MCLSVYVRKRDQGMGCIVFAYRIQNDAEFAEFVARLRSSLTESLSLSPFLLSHSFSRSSSADLQKNESTYHDVIRGRYRRVYVRVYRCARVTGRFASTFTRFYALCKSARWPFANVDTVSRGLTRQIPPVILAAPSILPSKPSHFDRRDNRSARRSIDHTSNLGKSYGSCPTNRETIRSYRYDLDVKVPRRNFKTFKKESPILL